MTLRKLASPKLSKLSSQATEAPTGASNDVTAFIALIERVARDPSIDIDKLDRLLLMRERETARLAEQAFSTALAEAQTEMVPVVADSNNPQTRSRYASYAALDRAVRPIYTRHGFGLSFNTDDAPGQEQARILCDVCHSGGHTRRYRIDMPVDGKGAKGGDVMTRTHAMGSGVSYGMRYLLRMVFNLAIDRDDDGNAAGYRTRAVTNAPVNGDNVTGATISERAIAARVSQARQGQPTEPFYASEAGKGDLSNTHVWNERSPHLDSGGRHAPADADISGRRAAVQLRNALPQPAYVIEPPQRRLQRELAAMRIDNRYEAQIRSERLKEGRFQQPIPNLPDRQVYDERHPPPDDTIPDGPGAPKLDHTDRGGVPVFLDRRKPNDRRCARDLPRPGGRH
jgi:hypothetical protein